MTASIPYRTPEPRAREAFLLWFGVLGGPLAWGTQLVVGYGLEEIACSNGTASNSIWGLGVESAIWIVNAVTAATALLAGIAARRARRAAARGSWPDPRGRASFMGTVGLLASGLFLLLIVVGSVALVFVDSCVAG